jgi:hypothetical protein
MEIHKQQLFMGKKISKNTINVRGAKRKLKDPWAGGMAQW